MVWGAFAYGGLADLVILPKGQIMDSKVYLNILSDHLLDCLQLRCQDPSTRRYVHHANLSYLWISVDVGLLILYVQSLLVFNLVGVAREWGSIVVFKVEGTPGGALSFFKL